MGKTFDVAKASEAQYVAPAAHNNRLFVGAGVESYLHSGLSWCLQLGDPAFQDLSRDSKFYLHYCK
jgi:hypothetical protein